MWLWFLPQGLGVKTLEFAVSGLWLRAYDFRV